MALSRAPLGFLLLAAGIACGYGFVRSSAPVPGSRLMIQDTTTPSLPLFPDLNLPVNREQIASANTEARADELRAAPTPSGGQDLALAVQKELLRAGCYEGVADGSWDKRSKIAMKQFLDRVNAR